MCGVAGMVDFRDPPATPDLAVLAAMAGALRHRGPDAFGVYRDARAGLAHARLAIVDREGGAQPLSNEDGTLWLAYNGEVFNYVELRRELESLGHRFRTRSDTEVVVHAWEAWRERAFSRLNGQYALALWDERNEELVLARDPMGVRPLYLREHAGRLLFASEVKALFAADPSLPRALDPTGLIETFTFWSVVPPQSVFQGIEELKPGHLRVVSRAGAKEHGFWRPRYPAGSASGFRGSLPEATRLVSAALEKAIAVRILRSDVPVGCYLSGGLDSSLVAALGRRVKGDRFQTFSVRFEDAEFDETASQRAVAACVGSDHHELLVRRRDIAEALPDVVRHAERPVLRTAPAPLFLLSRMVRSAGIKVVLTGEGADEMFAGYDLFREGRVRRFWARQPDSSWRPRLLDRLYPWLERSPMARPGLARDFFSLDLERWREPGFAHSTRWRTTAALHRLMKPELRRAAGVDVVARLLDSLPPDFASWTFLAQDQYLEVRTLLSGYLLSSQGDRMLMAHSVEGRFPFLDAEVVELANALPDSYKLRGLREKHVLKRIADGLLPPEVARRAKQPYRAPDALCFFGPDAPDWVAETISERALADAAVFDPRAVAALWRKCGRQAEAGSFSNQDNMAVLGVLSTQLLHEQLVRGRLHSEAPVALDRLVDRVPLEATP